VKSYRRLAEAEPAAFEPDLAVSPSFCGSVGIWATSSRSGIFVEMMAERGISVVPRTHSALGPALRSRCSRSAGVALHARSATRGGLELDVHQGSWRLGLPLSRRYRAVDARGQTVDFRLSPKRDVAAAKTFFRKAFKDTRTGAAHDHRRIQASHWPFVSFGGRSKTEGCHDPLVPISQQ
jgi:hypothetical protein